MWCGVTMQLYLPMARQVQAKLTPCSGLTGMITSVTKILLEEWEITVSEITVTSSMTKANSVSFQKQ